MRPAILAAALALTPLAGRAATTELSLQASGHAQAAPDRLCARLAAEATSPDPAHAQDSVNDAVRQAAQAVTRAEPALVFTAGEYETSREDKPSAPSGWTATQHVTLCGPATSAGTLLPLTGRLQHQGLALEGLDWSLSDATRTRLREDAIRDAASRLQHDVGLTAQALGLHVVQFKTVTLRDDGGNPPLRMVATAAAPMRTEAPRDVSVTLHATAILTP